MEERGGDRQRARFSAKLGHSLSEWHLIDIVEARFQSQRLRPYIETLPGNAKKRVKAISVRLKKFTVTLLFPSTTCKQTHSATRIVFRSQICKSYFSSITIFPPIFPLLIRPRNALVCSCDYYYVNDRENRNNELGRYIGYS